jgi:CMP-N,N'-diacetyllegionaminic acid synthase
MFKKKKICCIVTARKNSKGIKNKNLLTIKNKPLIYYPIKAALKSKYVDKVFFNSDCKKMIKLSKIYGAATNFIRPRSLASSKIKSVDVLIHHINKEKLDVEFDYLLLLEPTSPLTTSNDIDKSITKLINKKFTSLLSVATSTTPSSFLSFKIFQNRLLPTSKKKIYTTRRQDFPKRYFIDGSLYLTKINELKKYKSFLQKKTTFIIMDKYKNFQIDDLIDYKIIKFLSE